MAKKVRDSRTYDIRPMSQGPYIPTYTLTLNRLRDTFYYIVSRTFRILELEIDSKISNLFCLNSKKGMKKN